MEWKKMLIFIQEILEQNPYNISFKDTHPDWMEIGAITFHNFIPLPSHAFAFGVSLTLMGIVGLLLLLLLSRVSCVRPCATP